ncbi:MAG: hypothetical protein M1837_004552 [Sclerophora amabilis]|nr:MAG: hypothetical protein M1837_004552 [Sclerophora amabilis]
MAASRSRYARRVVIILSAIAVVSNSLTAYLFHQLPDDPYHLALNFSAYSHFASVLSILGFVGTIKEHALSVAIFANYFIIDTILCAVPRFLFMTLFSELRESVCSPPLAMGFDSFSFVAAGDGPVLSDPPATDFTHGPRWSKEECLQVAWIFQMVASVGVVGLTFVQFLLALQVRAYANDLFAREQPSGWEEGKSGVDRRELMGFSDTLRTAEKTADLVE